MDKNIIAKLEQPLAIKQIAGKNKFNYIDGDDVRKRLNEAFDYEWSEELIDSSFDSNGAIVKLYIVVNDKNSPTGVIRKLGLGQSNTSGNSALGIGDALKTAHTNAVKDAAKGFGIGVGMTTPAAPVAETRPQNRYTKYDKPTECDTGYGPSNEEEVASRYEEPITQPITGSAISSLATQVQAAIAPSSVSSEAPSVSFVPPLSTPTYPTAKPQVSKGSVKEITGMQLGALKNIAKKEKMNELDIIKALYPDFIGEDFSNLTLPEASTLIKHWRSNSN